MKHVVVVGSGPSGMHFAVTLLNKGYRVTMIDAGVEKPAPVLPDSSFDDLRKDLSDPAGYLLGQQFEAVSLPGSDADFYAFPPSKRYVFEAARELLFNVVKHGGVAEASLSLSYPGGDRVRIKVADAGAGFDPAAGEQSAARTSLGLLALRQRLRAVGGTLMIDAAPGHGTRAVVELPLE